MKKFIDRFGTERKRQYSLGFQLGDVVKRERGLCMIQRFYEKSCWIETGDFHDCEWVKISDIKKVDKKTAEKFRKEYLVKFEKHLDKFHLRRTSGKHTQTIKALDIIK